MSLVQPHDLGYTTVHLHITQPLPVPPPTPPPPAVLPNRKCLCLLSCLESLQGLCKTDYDSVWYSKSVNPPPDFTLAPALQHQPLQKISGRTSDLAPHSYAGLNCGIS